MSLCDATIGLIKVSLKRIDISKFAVDMRIGVFVLLDLSIPAKGLT